MKKKLLYTISTWVIRTLSLAVMLAITVGSVAYLRGYFDFTFIERVDPTKPSRETETDAVTDEPTPDTGTLETEVPDVGTQDTGMSDAPVTAPPAETPSQETVQKPAAVTAATVSASLTKTKTAKSTGYRDFTEGIFQKGKTILTNTGITGLGTEESYSMYDVRVTVTNEYGDHGCFVTEESIKSVPRPAVTLKNGYIIRDVGGKLSLLRSDGATLLSDYDENVFRVTDLRDRDGNVLFAAVKRETRTEPVPIMKKDEITGRLVETGYYEEDMERKVEVEVLTYYTLSADGKWVQSDYTDANPHPESDKGLSFAMPQDYGESDCDLVRFKQGTQWGYKNEKTGETVVYPQYKAAYNFHDGYAVALDNYYIYFLNEKGTVVNRLAYSAPEVFVTNNELTLPDTNGIESLGTYYFSHGLTRVRLRENLVTYKYYNYIKSSDKPVLIDVQGNEYKIPDGYSLLSYSDGVMLIQNNETGLYGCMNYKGAWVVWPEYRSVTPSLSGMIVVENKRGKMGVVDTEGNEILPCVYDYISAPVAGMLAVYDETLPTKWEVYKVMTK